MTVADALADLIPGRCVAFDVASIFLGKRKTERAGIHVDVSFVIRDVGHRKGADQGVEMQGVIASARLEKFWAGEASGFEIVEVAEIDRTVVNPAEAVDDFASLFQAVWAPHFIVTAYPFGGMCTPLGDGEWLDQRDHRFAGPFVQIVLLTGRQNLVERGIAVSRSSLTVSAFGESG